MQKKRMRSCLRLHGWHLLVLFFNFSQFLSFFSKKLLTKAFLFDIITSACGNICGNAAMAQLVEHILGKDEVPSSNLGSSSKQKHPSFRGVFLFGSATHASNSVPRVSRGIQFAFPARSSTSSLVRRRARKSSPSANTWVSATCSTQVCRVMIAPMGKL